MPKEAGWAPGLAIDRGLHWTQLKYSTSLRRSAIGPGPIIEKIIRSGPKIIKIVGFGHVLLFLLISLVIESSGCCHFNNISSNLVEFLSSNPGPGAEPTNTARFLIVREK